MSTKKQNIILSIAHVYDLIFFYRLMNEKNIAENYEIKVLFQHHKYFNDKMHIAQKILYKLTNRVIHVKNSEIPRYSFSVINHIFLAFRFKKMLKGKFDKNDIVLILDKSTFASNIIFNYFNKIILFQFSDNSKKIDYIPHFKKNILVSVYHKVLNLHNIRVFRLRRSEKLVEKYLITLKKIRVVTISDEINKEGIYFSTVHTPDKEKKIVIFGSRYLHWGLADANIKKIRYYYQKIYRFFGEDYSFLYVKHPLENLKEYEELNKLYQGSLKLVTGYLNSEHFLLENTDISHCFSIGSTSSKSAYQMGFNSTVAYRWALSGTTIVDAFEGIFHDIPEDIHYVDTEDSLSNQRSVIQISANIDQLEKYLTLGESV